LFFYQCFHIPASGQTSAVVRESSVFDGARRVGKCVPLI
jgi:hypothetical protein